MLLESGVVDFTCTFYATQFSLFTPCSRCGKVTAIAEILFVELFHSLFSLDDELNEAQSMIINFKSMS